MTKEERLKKRLTDILIKYIDEYVKEEAVEFFKWNARKVSSYIEYIEKVKALAQSREIEEALNVYECSTLEERYDLYCKSKTNL